MNKLIRKYGQYQQLLLFICVLIFGTSSESFNNSQFEIPNLEQQTYLNPDKSVVRVNCSDSNSDCQVAQCQNWDNQYWQFFDQTNITIQFNIFCRPNIKDLLDEIKYEINKYYFLGLVIGNIITLPLIDLFFVGRYKLIIIGLIINIIIKLILFFMTIDFYREIQFIRGIESAFEMIPTQLVLIECCNIKNKIIFHSILLASWRAPTLLNFMIQNSYKTVYYVQQFGLMRAMIVCILWQIFVIESPNFLILSGDIKGQKQACEQISQFEQNKIERCDVSEQLLAEIIRKEPIRSSKGSHAPNSIIKLFLILLSASLVVLKQLSANLSFQNASNPILKLNSGILFEIISNHLTMVFSFSFVIVLISLLKIQIIIILMIMIMIICDSIPQLNQYYFKYDIAIIEFATQKLIESLCQMAISMQTFKLTELQSIDFRGRVISLMFLVMIGSYQLFDKILSNQNDNIIQRYSISISILIIMILVSIPQKNIQNLKTTSKFRNILQDSNEFIDFYYENEMNQDYQIENGNKIEDNFQNE